MVVISMSDRFVCDALLQDRVVTPQVVRDRMLEFAKTGACGPEQQQRAKALLKSTADATLRLNLFLITEIVRRRTDGKVEMMIEQAATVDGQRMANRTLRDIAKDLSIELEGLHDRLGVWAATVVDVGLAKSPDPPRLRMLAKAVKSASAEWAEAAEQDQILGSVRSPLRMLGRVAKETATIVDLQLKGYETFFDQYEQTLITWDQARL